MDAYARKTASDGRFKTSLSPTPALRSRLASIVVDLTAQVGAYPHAAMSVPSSIYASPKPAPKAACPKCGFRVSMLKKYLDYGPPICPKDRVEMEAVGEWA